MGLMTSVPVGNSAPAPSGGRARDIGDPTLGPDGARPQAEERYGLRQRQADGDVGSAPDNWTHARNRFAAGADSTRPARQAAGPGGTRREPHHAVPQQQRSSPPLRRRWLLEARTGPSPPLREHAQR